MKSRCQALLIVICVLSLREFILIGLRRIPMNLLKGSRLFALAVVPVLAAGMFSCPSD